MKGSKRVEVQMHLRDMDMDRKRDVFCRQHIMISDSSLHESLRATPTTDMILYMEQRRAREIYSNGKQPRLGGIAFKINERAIAAQAIRFSSNVSGLREYCVTRQQALLCLRRCKYDFVGKGLAKLTRLSSWQLDQSCLCLTKRDCPYPARESIAHLS